MIVTCSACKTRYLTDPVALGHAGRMVRCAKCGHTWMQAPPADLPFRVDVLSPPDGGRAPPPKFNLPAPYIPPPKRRRGMRVALAIAAAIVIIVGAGYFARNQIVAAWPSAQRVYDLIGGLTETSTSSVAVGDVRLVLRPNPRTGDCVS